MNLFLNAGPEHVNFNGSCKFQISKGWYFYTIFGMSNLSLQPVKQIEKIQIKNLNKYFNSKINFSLTRLTGLHTDIELIYKNRRSNLHHSESL